MSETISNIPERVDLRIKQGSSFTFTAKFPFSLTGQEVRLRAKKRVTSNTPLIVLDNAGNGGVSLSTTDVADDTVTVLLSGAQSAAIECGCWVYDFERAETPIFSGAFEIVGEI